MCVGHRGAEEAGQEQGVCMCVGAEEAGQEQGMCMCVGHRGAEEAAAE